MVMTNVLEKTAVNNYNTAVGSANTQIQSATTINSQVNNIITDATSFLKKFKKFSIEIISKIGAIFIRTLFELLKKDILGLLGAIIEDISNSERKKRYKKILRLVGIATQLAGEIIKGLEDLSWSDSAHCAPSQCRIAQGAPKPTQPPDRTR